MTLPKSTVKSLYLAAGRVEVACSRPRVFHLLTPQEVDAAATIVDALREVARGERS